MKVLATLDMIIITNHPPIGIKTHIPHFITIITRTVVLHITHLLIMIRTHKFALTIARLKPIPLIIDLLLILAKIEIAPIVTQIQNIILVSMQLMFQLILPKIIATLTCTISYHVLKTMQTLSTVPVGFSIFKFSNLHMIIPHLPDQKYCSWLVVVLAFQF